MIQESATPKPKIWKLLVIAWLYAYPVINIFFAIIGPYINGLHPLLRSLIVTVFLVPALGLGVPAVQRRFYKWTVR